MVEAAATQPKWKHGHYCQILYLCMYNFLKRSQKSGFWGGYLTLCVPNRTQLSHKSGNSAPNRHCQMLVPARIQCSPIDSGFERTAQLDFTDSKSLQLWFPDS